MNFLSLVLLGIGLAMDASCVSMAKGMTMEKSQRFRYALSLGLAFGFFSRLYALSRLVGRQLFSRLYYLDRPLDCIFAAWNYRLSHD